MKPASRRPATLLRFLLGAFLATSASAAPQWLAEPELLPVPDQAQGDFGSAVAMDGDMLVVGAPDWTHLGMPRAGSVAVLRRTPGWTQTLLLTASDASTNASLGDAVAVSGDLVVVGAGSAGGTGAAYLFRASNGTERLRFVPGEVNSGDDFGESVAADGEYYVVGAPDHDPVEGFDAGGAWLYRDGAGLIAFLIGSDTVSQDHFGSSVAVSGDTVVVGAYGHDLDQNNAGAAYVFDLQGNQVQKLTASDAASADVFGASVAIDGERMLVCSKDAGYVFERSGSTWSETARLSAGWPDGTSGQFKGALSGDRVVIGIPQADAGVGRAVFYERQGSQWVLLEEVFGPNGVSGDFFGGAVAIDGGLAAVGAPFVEGPQGAHTGRVYPFQADVNPAFCNGGALSLCPCANSGTADTGCDNAQGTGGVKAEFVSVDPNGGTAWLVATGFPTNGAPTAIVMRSASLAATPQPIFDGVRCIAVADLTRMAAAVAGGGTSRHLVRHLLNPGTFHYQVWYRNQPSYCTASPSNVSSGDSLTW